MATVLIDVQDVLSIAEIVVRLERGYRRLEGPIRRRVDDLFRSWNIGLSLSGGGFTATLQRNPHVNAEAVLLRLLELPSVLFERDGTTCLVAFDEIQDVLSVPGADGKIRSVIQCQAEAATYAFAGSAPGVMQQLFADPKRRLLDQAVPRHLAPLALDDVADYVSAGAALDLDQRRHSVLVEEQVVDGPAAARVLGIGKRSLAANQKPERRGVAPEYWSPASRLGNLAISLCSTSSASYGLSRISTSSSSPHNKRSRRSHRRS